MRFQSCRTAATSPAPLNNPLPTPCANDPRLPVPTHARARVHAGGVYIAGGITPRLLPRTKGALLEGFLMRKGRPPFHQILSETPLFVITNDKVGQIGAREVAKRLV